MNRDITETAKLNVVLATDENYVVPTAVVVESIISNNNDNVELFFYIVCDRLNEWSTETRLLLEKYDQQNNSSIILQDSLVRDAWCKKNHFLKYKGSYGIYTKFFMTEIVQDRTCNVLWLDSDIVVNGSLLELAQKENGIWCCYDMNNSRMWKRMLGFEKKDTSFVGIFSVFLVNPAKWKEIDAIGKITNWIDRFRAEEFENVCDLICVDQGILSGALEGNLQILPMNYQVLPGQYLFTYKSFLSLFGLNKTEFYSEKDYYSALKSPKVIHFMHFIVPKPWYHDEMNPCEKMWMEYYRNIEDSHTLFPLKNLQLKGQEKYKRIIFRISKQIYVLLGSRYTERKNIKLFEKLQNYYRI